MRTLVFITLFIATILLHSPLFSQGIGVSDQQVKVLELLEKKKVEFQNTSNDSIFVTQNSDSPYRFIYLRRGDEPEEVEDEIYKAKVGQVVGPFRSENFNYLFKVLQHDSIRQKFRVSHVFINVNGSTANDTLEAFNKAQKIAKALNKGDDISSIIEKEGSDYKNIASSLGFNIENPPSDGDLGWIWEGTTIYPINQGLVKAKKGEAIAVRTKYGSHVLQVRDKGQGYYKTKIISIVKKLK